MGDKYPTDEWNTRLSIWEFVKQNFRYLIGYRIFVNVAPTVDFSVFPE